MSSSLGHHLEQERHLVEVDQAEGLEEAHGSQLRLTWRRFRRHRLALIGLFLLVVFYLSVIFAAQIAPYHPNQIDLEAVRQGPSWRHLMGTDALGRDTFSRVLHGGRVSLAVGLGAALSGGILGVAVGAIAGYFGAWVDNLLMRVADLFLALPFLAVAMMLSVAFQGGMRDIVIILAILFWMPVARIVRGMFLSIKEKEYVEAARASGAGPFRIITRHMLPNSLGPIIVNVTLGIAFAILAESTLSFFGFGIKAPAATWGNMLSGARESLVSEPWLAWFPGMMILLTVLSVNFVGDGLRDALDPTGRRTRA